LRSAQQQLKQQQQTKMTTVTAPNHMAIGMISSIK